MNSTYISKTCYTYTIYLYVIICVYINYVKLCSNMFNNVGFMIVHTLRINWEVNTTPPTTAKALRKCHQALVLFHLDLRTGLVVKLHLRVNWRAVYIMT